MLPQGAQAREQVFGWSASELHRLLEADEMMNISTLASVQSALNSMENGWRAKVFPKSVAKAVLERAAKFRQAEAGPTSRWVSACIVESLAMMRLISLSEHSLRERYVEARNHTLRQLNEIINQPKALAKAKGNKGMPKLTVTQREGAFQQSFISVGTPFKNRGSQTSQQKKPAQKGLTAAERKRLLRTPGVAGSPTKTDKSS